MLVAKEVDGIEMGVLSDGTPFLTGAGLAKACGVPRGVIYQRAIDWKDGKRDGKLARLLLDAGFDEPLMYTPLDGGRVHAYTDSVSTIVIEYYALDATPTNATARTTLRRLTRHGLRNFIYRAIGFDPRDVLPPGWREYRDRLTFNTAPPGYFSVFREMAEFLVRAIGAGLMLDSSTVPDGSVGKIWSNYWVECGLAASYGERKKHEHNFPPSYPQSLSNPQDIWVYPIDACGAFRRWLDEVYIPEKFPRYLSDKVKKKTMASALAMGLLAAVTPAKLTEGAEEDEEEEEEAPPRVARRAR
jgi:hypothetical protein